MVGPLRLGQCTLHKVTPLGGLAAGSACHCACPEWGEVCTLALRPQPVTQSGCFLLTLCALGGLSCGPGAVRGGLIWIRGLFCVVVLI